MAVGLLRSDRVDFAGLASGVVAEEDANGGREAKSQQDGRWRERSGPASDVRRPDRPHHAENDTNRPAGYAEGRRFHQELSQDVLPARADGRPDADLSGSLGDRHDMMAALAITATASATATALPERAGHPPG